MSDIETTLQTIGRELDKVRAEYPGNDGRRIYLNGYEDGIRFCLECYEKERPEPPGSAV